MKVGELYSDGSGRLYQITELDHMRVWYNDCYGDGAIEQRIASRIQWEMEIEKGTLEKIGE